MKNLLVVSIALPPKSDPESIQTGKYLKYLLEKATDYKISVVTSSTPTLYMPVDDSLSIYENEYEQIIKVKLFEARFFNILINKIC